MNPVDRFARLLLAGRIQRQFYKWDHVQLKAHQNRRLAVVLDSAACRSPYYSRLRAEGWDGTLPGLPVIPKSELVAHFDEINTAGLRAADLSAFSIARERAGRVVLYLGKYSVGLSSGTSGSRLVTVLSPSERWQYACLLYARSGIPENVRSPRILFALRVNNPAFMETRALGVTLVHVSYTHPPEEVIDLINRKNLNILAGPPSLLRMLARLHDRIDHTVEGVISYAEVLDNAARVEIETAFGVRVGQIYQGAEGFIASTCWAGSLHLNEDALLLEEAEAGDSIGRARKLIVTDLYRQTQPFLHYSMEDLVELSGQPCTCGSCFRVVERIHGRADDIFYLESPTGQRCLFPDYVTRSINQASDAVLEFQAIQHAPDRIEIRLELAPGANRAAIEQQINANLTWWAEKAGGRLGIVSYTSDPPERNRNSHKLIRVVRRY